MKNENQLNFTSYLVKPQVNLSHKVWKTDSWSILSHLTGEFICSSFGVSGKNWFTDVKVKSPKLFALICLAGDVPHQMSCKCQCSLFLYEIHFQGLCDIGERPDKRQRALKRQTFRSSQKNYQKLATRAELKAKWSRERLSLAVTGQHAHSTDREASCDRARTTFFFSKHLPENVLLC